MIITITGKPCSGKGTVSKMFCQKYNFEYICTGDMFRALAKENGFDNILTFQLNEDIKKIDALVDNQIIDIGKNRMSENIVIDSRLAWHFIPQSFKVFIDVDLNVAAKRLLEANRENENVNTIEESKQALEHRWKIENERYQELYATNNLNLNNYDLVISSNNKTPEEIVEIIYQRYIKLCNHA